MEYSDFVDVERAAFEACLLESGWKLVATGEQINEWQLDQTYFADLEEVTDIADARWTRVDYRGSDNPVASTFPANRWLSVEDDEACHAVFGCAHYGGAGPCPEGC